MAVNAFVSNQGTQSSLLTDNTGGTGGTLIPIMKLDISAIGTFTKSWDGNVQGGTIGSVVGIGSVSGLSNLPGGTVTNLVSGTINAATVTLNSGTINVGTFVMPSGTLSIGSVGGRAASGAAIAGNPIPVGGTDSGGTVYGFLTDTKGQQYLGGGTVTTVTTLSNLSAGSVNVIAGTIATLGTMGTLGLVNTVTSVTGLASGTINLGTFVGNGGSMISYGPAAAAAAAAGNPVNIGGTDSGGTIRTIKVDSGGLQRIGIDSGTISVLPNLPQGSINVTAGTIATLGTMGTLGLVNTVTTVSNLSAGSVNVVAGTIATLGTMGTLGLVNTVTTVSNLTNGSIVQTSGTFNTGTLSPIPTIANVTFGTHGTTGVSIFGTLAGGTGSGAGTEIFITSLSLTIPSTGGSQDVSVGWGTNGGTFQAGTGLLVRGNFPPGGGIQKTFWPPVNSGTNSQLCLFQAGAGTVDVDVTYFITPSTL